MHFFLQAAIVLIIMLHALSVGYFSRVYQVTRAVQVNFQSSVGQADREFISVPASASEGGISITAV